MSSLIKRIQLEQEIKDNQDEVYSVNDVIYDECKQKRKLQFFKEFDIAENKKLGFYKCTGLNDTNEI